MKKRLAAFALAMCVALTGTACKSKDVDYSNVSKTAFKQLYKTAEKDLNKYVKLGDYKNISYDKLESDEVDEDEVNDQIQELLEENPIPEAITDRAVKNGDTISMDFTGTYKGEQFDGGTATDYTVTIGSGTLMSDFESQLIGKKPGKEFEITVKFPENYTNTEIDGQNVQFKITIHYIEGETKVSEFNDHFAKSMGFETAEEMRQSLIDEWQSAKDSETALRNKNTLKQIITDNAKTTKKFDELVDTEIDRLKANKAKQKDTFEAYLKENNLTEDEYYDNMREQLENVVKTQAVFIQIAKKEKVTVSLEEYKKTLESNKGKGTQYGFESDEAYFEVNGVSILQGMIVDKAVDYCYKNAK